MRTAKAGITPSPRDRRQTARRCFSPNLGVSKEGEKGDLEGNWEKRPHPKQNQRYKGGDNETEINHCIWGK
jgi:hypothetical protein